jgi:hypothetical protein
MRGRAGRRAPPPPLSLSSLPLLPAPPGRAAPGDTPPKWRRWSPGRRLTWWAGGGVVGWGVWRRGVRNTHTPEGGLRGEERGERARLQLQPLTVFFFSSRPARPLQSFSPYLSPPHFAHHDGRRRPPVQPLERGGHRGACSVGARARGRSLRGGKEKKGGAGGDRGRRAPGGAPPTTSTAPPLPGKEGSMCLGARLSAKRLVSARRPASGPCPLLTARSGGGAASAPAAAVGPAARAPGGAHGHRSPARPSPSCGLTGALPGGGRA